MAVADAGRWVCLRQHQSSSDFCGGFGKAVAHSTGRAVALSRRRGHEEQGRDRRKTDSGEVVDVMQVEEIRKAEVVSREDSTQVTRCARSTVEQGSAGQASMQLPEDRSTSDLWLGTPFRTSPVRLVRVLWLVWALAGTQLAYCSAYYVCDRHFPVQWILSIER